MGRHTRSHWMTSRRWGVLIGALAVVGLGATTGLAATGGFGGVINTSDTPADGGVYRVTVKDGRLDSLQFIPDATQSPSASTSGTPAPSTSASPSATSTAPATGTSSAPVVTTTPAPTSSSTTPAPTTAPSATQSPSTSASGTPAPSTSASPSASSTAPAVAAGDWLSGASGEGATDGRLGTWRGTPVEIVGTWADQGENQTKPYTVMPGGSVASWSGPIDIGVGAILSGESWAGAARGDYDARWRTSLTTLKQYRGGKGTTYIRFAHEMNGNWFPWSVKSADQANFVAAWKRYRAIQKQVFPEAKLVFSVNRESNGTGFDWTKAFPGAQYVDVMGVDYYNQYPAVNSAAAFKDSLDDRGRYGEPKGLDTHLAFAKSQGLPLSINEWSGVKEFGDNAEYMSLFNSYLKTNGGPGAGQILYEVLFNVGGYNGNFQLYPSTSQPAAAARYRDVF